MDRIISFPHMGNYCVPIGFLLRAIFGGCEIKPSPPITQKTLELGSRHSPDFVCVPFKYNLGNFIEALENGANVLVQAGGGCRYGYYGEIQERILRDLGYDFTFICLIGQDLNLKSFYGFYRRLGCTASFPRFIYSLLLSCKMARVMDAIEFDIRRNIGFEVRAGSFERLHARFLHDLERVTGFRSLNRLHKAYRKRFREIPIDKPEGCLKVGLVGELYTLMEPFSNFFLEKELAKHRIEISRFINVTYLLFQKERRGPSKLRAAGKYLKYHIGADGTDSVADARTLAEKGYDGIIHVKPFGCTPEVNAMPMLQNIGTDYKIPILYLSFDSQTSEAGVRTRLEAFNDMLVMRAQKRQNIQAEGTPCLQDI